MTKRSDRTPPKSNKKPIDSPNPRELKQTRPKNMVKDAMKNDKETVERDKIPENDNNNTNNLEMQKLNLLGKFKSAESKQGDVCGGQALWANLVSPAKTTWAAIEANTRKAQKAYKLEDKFQEGPYSLHNLAASGKNSRGVGLKQTLLAEGWKNLFKGLFETIEDLSGTETGDRLCMFGLRLAKTPPKEVFDGAD